MFGIGYAFLKGFWRGFKCYYGACDDHYFTNYQRLAAEETANTLEECKPITDHFDPEHLEILRGAIDSNDVNTAHEIIQDAEDLNGRHWCYDALRYALAIYNTCSPDVLRHATFSYIYDLVL